MRLTVTLTLEEIGQAIQLWLFQDVLQTSSYRVVDCERDYSESPTSFTVKLERVEVQTLAGPAIRPFGRTVAVDAPVNTPPVDNEIPF